MSSIPLPNPLAQYHESATFALYAHTAPSRCGMRREKTLFNEAERDLEQQLNGRLAHCARHTVQPREKHPTHQVNLRKGLTVGLSHLRFAQVWMVECGGQTMVARFYDPLYIADDTRRYDIFRLVDDVVAVEVDAYAALAQLQGSLIPRFLGYFMTMVAAPAGLEDQFPKRNVQVILLEFIPGESLFALSPRTGSEACDEEEPDDDGYLFRIRHTRLSFVCDEHKNTILDAVLLADHLFILNGVYHMDLEERNVILKAGPSSPTAFCGVARCALRHRFPTDSLIRQVESEAGRSQPVDYSTLTMQQIASLPIAVIDFGCAVLVEDHLKSRNELQVRMEDSFRYTTEFFVDASRPERYRAQFLLDWCCSKWLPSTYKYEPVY